LGLLTRRLTVDEKRKIHARRAGEKEKKEKTSLARGRRRELKVTRILQSFPAPTLSSPSAPSLARIQPSKALHSETESSSMLRLLYSQGALICPTSVRPLIAVLRRSSRSRALGRRRLLSRSRLLGEIAAKEQHWHLVKTGKKKRRRILSLALRALAQVSPAVIASSQADFPIPRRQKQHLLFAVEPQACYTTDARMTFKFDAFRGKRV